MSGGAQDGHKAKYKNAGLDAQELRRRREEEGVQIRKNKREQQLFKRRNVFDAEAASIQVRRSQKYDDEALFGIWTQIAYLISLHRLLRKN